jgi:hypothetical protein
MREKGMPKRQYTEEFIVEVGILPLRTPEEMALYLDACIEERYALHHTHSCQLMRKV